MSKSIKKNYIYNVIYNLCIIVLPLIVTPYISRVLQPNGIGKYSFASSIITFFTIFANLGFLTYAQREIAKFQTEPEKQNTVFVEIIICRAIPTLIAVAVNLTLYFCGVYGGYSVLMLILTINILSIALDGAFYFQGNERFGSLIIRSTFVRILSIACVFIFVKQEGDLWIYALINSLSGVVGSILLLPEIIKKLRSNKVLKVKPFKHFKGALILFIPAIATSIYLILDKTLIGLLVPGTYPYMENGVEVIGKVSDLENGFYEQAEKIVKTIMTIITCIGSVMIPRNTHEIKEGNIDIVKRNTYKAARAVWMIGIPLVLGLCAIAENFVPWFFGQGYEKCITLMYILSPIIVIIGFSSIYGMLYMLPMGKDKQYTACVLIGACINLIVNLILIPKLYSVGAAIGTVVSELFVTIAMIVFNRGELSFVKMVSSIWKYLIAGGVMFASVYTIQMFFIPTYYFTIALIAIGICIYVLMLLLLRDQMFLEYTKSVINHLRHRTKDTTSSRNDKEETVENKPRENDTTPSDNE